MKNVKYWTFRRNSKTVEKLYLGILNSIRTNYWDIQGEIWHITQKKILKGKLPYFKRKKKEGSTATTGRNITDEIATTKETNTEISLE